jgi:hypothetical protein
MAMIVKNTGSEDKPCVRRGCPGIEPGTAHRPSLTASMCEVLDLADDQDTSGRTET